MKIHAFRVFQAGQVTLDRTLQYVAGLPIEQRLRDVMEWPVRIEEAQKINDRWLIDFAGIRHEGPGRASATAPIEDFDMEEEEGFGHEMAVCFDVASGFATVQYNHFGPRLTRIQNYLYGFCRQIEALPEGEQQTGYAFIPVLKGDAAERLNHMGLVKNIEVSFYVPGLRAQPNARRQSLSSILDAPLLGSADRVRLQITAGRGRGSTLAIQQVRAMVNDLLGSRDEVLDLRITAKENEEAPSEPVDFIEARLEADIPVERVGRRYGRPQRWAALQQAFDTWHGNGQLS